jgi:CheY-like chemotaxis protein
MDMEMPGIGGLEATAKIRELGHSMPIYVVSGNIGNDDVRRCLDAGANGHIAKPLNREQIVSAIHSSLQKVI